MSKTTDVLLDRVEKLARDVGDARREVTQAREQRDEVGRSRDRYMEEVSHRDRQLSDYAAQVRREQDTRGRAVEIARDQARLGKAVIETADALLHSLPLSTSQTTQLRAAIKAASARLELFDQLPF